MKWLLALAFITSLSFAADPVDTAKKNAEFLKKAESSLKADLKEAEADLKELTTGSPAYDQKLEEIDLKKNQIKKIEYARERLEKEGTSKDELKNMQDVERYAGTSTNGVVTTKKGLGLSTSDIDDSDPLAAATLRQLLEPQRFYGKSHYLELKNRSHFEFLERQSTELKYSELLIPRMNRLRKTTGLDTPLLERIVGGLLSGKFSAESVKDYLLERGFSEKRSDRLFLEIEKLREEHRKLIDPLENDK